MAPKKRTTRASPAITTTTTTPVTNAQLKALIYQGIADALAACDIDRSMNGNDSHNLGTGNGNCVMVAPSIPISVEENLGDPIDIRVDIIHLEPVVAVAFLAAAFVRTQAQHGEAIRGILEYLQGVPIKEEMSTLRFRIGMVEAENDSLRDWSTETRESQTRRCRKYDQEGYTEEEVRDRMMLKDSPWKGVVLAKDRAIAYKLELPQELSRVHNTFHVSNLKKCYADEPLAIPLDGLHLDDRLQFFEEPVEIMDREVKRLRQNHVPIVKV
ncbi:hypothetical protein Tco_1400961 [Tanacetum coccineum]